MRAQEHAGGAEAENRRQSRNLIVLDEVDSTNTWLKQHGSELPNGTVVLAHRQTAGRGRMGRQWQDEPGSGLAMSMLVKQPWAKLFSLLPLIAGVSVCEALTELSCSSLFSIKWSNDILCNEKKVSGILCETRTMGSSSFSVIGIGVNLLHDQETLLQHDLVYATSLFLATRKKYTAQETADKICGKLENYLNLCAKNGIGNVLNLYRRSCISLGRQVRIASADGTTEGLALDIADDGALICKTVDGRIIHFRAGEVSVRGMEGYI